MNNRFYVASEKLQDIANLLIEKGYTELDEVVSPDELADKLFIDTKRETFYFTDEQCVKETNEILIEKYKVSYQSTTLKKLKLWK
ncbi:hypothetical protein [Flavobacterium caseinilyticum]|uniref:Uncharacterized protein n=1 Tax=Flavobacterium caseinilyticum TaxID=2541732 RepID=A0A4R5AZ13_9FLAO|nr:hypothetical protein [Flavobacterium caseinilyticum]TDD77086.1 hypothetical protein E0F89_05670 [Flavobacterium caseinilyticum]